MPDEIGRLREELKKLKATGKKLEDTRIDAMFSVIEKYLGGEFTLDDVYKTVKFLVVDNTGITGQSIKVDLGFTDFKDLI